MIDLLTIKAWAMEGAFLERTAPIVLRMLMGGNASIERMMGANRVREYQGALYPNQEIIDTDASQGTHIYAVKAKNGANVVPIRIQGGLTKNGGLCSMGMRHYGAIIEKLLANEKVAAIVLEMDTPGGSVDGTPELGEVIRQAQKPVVVYADGMVASAGYWIASQADAIVASRYNPTELGSIGVLYVHEYWGKYIENEIGEVRVIRAPQSVDKALVNALEPISEEQVKEIREELRAIANDFRTTVTSGRGARLQTGEEDIFTGKMYGAAKALELGMIDGIGTRMEAVEMAAQLAESSKLKAQSSVSETNQKGNKMSAWTKILGVLGMAQAEAEEPSAEQVEQASVQIEELAAANIRLQTEAEELRGQSIALENQVNSLTQERDTLQANADQLTARVAELEAELAKAPAGQATTVVAKEDESAQGAEKEYRTSVDDEADQYRGLK